MRRTGIRRTSRMEPGTPPRRTPFARNARQRPARASLTAREPETKARSAAARGAASGRRESFPPAVAALIDARDPWCVHCGSPRGLQRHHRRIKGSGGDSRPHTDCACNGVRICLACHDWAHSGKGRREAEAEGLVISRATAEPWTESVLVHTDADGGGMAKWPWCDGQYRDYPRPAEVAA